MSTCFLQAFKLSLVFSLQYQILQFYSFCSSSVFPFPLNTSSPTRAFLSFPSFTLPAFSSPFHVPFLACDARQSSSGWLMRRLFFPRLSLCIHPWRGRELQSTHILFFYSFSLFLFTLHTTSLLSSFNFLSSYILSLSSMSSFFSSLFHSFSSTLVPHILLHCLSFNPVLFLSLFSLLPVSLYYFLFLLSFVLLLSLLSSLLISFSFIRILQLLRLCSHHPHYPRTSFFSAVGPTLFYLSCLLLIAFPPHPCSPLHLFICLSLVLHTCHPFIHLPFHSASCPPLAFYGRVSFFLS